MSKFKSFLKKYNLLMLIVLAKTGKQACQENVKERTAHRSQTPLLVCRKQMIT